MEFIVCDDPEFVVLSGSHEAIPATLDNWGTNIIIIMPKDNSRFRRRQAAALIAKIVACAVADKQLTNSLTVLLMRLGILHIVILAILIIVDVEL